MIKQQGRFAKRPYQVESSGLRRIDEKKSGIEGEGGLVFSTGCSVSG